MKHLITAAAVFGLAGFAAAPASAQQAPAAAGARAQIEEVVERSGVREALEEVATVAAPELERAMEQLSVTLGALADRVARDPELRASALRAAQGAVNVAEVLVVERTSVLQEALRAAAERLEALAAAREPRTGG